ncbi:MAG: SLC13 family permease [bacterium]
MTTGLSAFLNNTPIVALFMPLATTWARRRGRSGRGLLMPLSYAAVLGGTCTMLGTSVHLVVHGLLLQHDMAGMQLFELTPIGLPVAVICLPALWVLSRRFLDPTARLPQTDEEVRREYTADLMVTADAPFLGQTVEAAGLRHLAGLFLVQIERGDQVITPVGPDDRLAAGTGSRSPACSTPSSTCSGAVAWSRHRPATSSRAG